MKYLKLMRIKHYIKNSFIFIPLVFSLSFTKPSAIFKALMAFVVFSLAASIVYVINDMVDVEKDRQHPKKCKRPIASGEVSMAEAKMLLIALVVACILISSLFLNLWSSLVILAYFVMNLAYSFKLKHVVLIDVFILSLGFIFRVYAGALAIGVEVSEWLLLTTFAISLFLGFGKRYGEKRKVKNEGSTRSVLNAYTEESLKYFMVISMSLTIVFYSLYAISGHSVIQDAVFTVPFVILGIFRYFMLLESSQVDGDPTDVVLNDRIIQGIVLLYLVLIFALILW